MKKKKAFYSKHFIYILDWFSYEINIKLAPYMTFNPPHWLENVNPFPKIPQIHSHCKYTTLHYIEMIQIWNNVKPLCCTTQSFFRTVISTNTIEIFKPSILPKNIFLTKLGRIPPYLHELQVLTSVRSWCCLDGCYGKPH